MLMSISFFRQNLSAMHPLASNEANLSGGQILRMLDYKFNISDLSGGARIDIF